MPDQPGVLPPCRWRRLTLLDLPIDALRLPDLLAFVSWRVHERRDEQSIILYVNVHCMNVASRDTRYADILRGVDIVYCDGTGVRLGARLAGLTIPERMTGADWIDTLADLAVKEGMRLFLLGGGAGSAEDAARVLTRRHPGLQVVGVASGYNISETIVHEINRSAADIVLVGMGTPTQERWIAAHAGDLEAPVVWAVGALFDFVSGRIPRGPRWMTEHGMEWMCRLTVEPKKLWRRYLIGNPIFLWHILRRYWFTRP
jgi:N-acetylglucosaminyldiphosphoundecaprenol N-acetyl-beta-D-mannosaminyltransferase